MLKASSVKGEPVPPANTSPCGDFGYFAPHARANRDDVDGINDVEQALLVFNDDIVPPNENKVRLRDGEFLSIGGADYQGALPNQLLPNQLSIHAALIAG